MQSADASQQAPDLVLLTPDNQQGTYNNYYYYTYNK
jgi:hypothetical protein